MKEREGALCSFQRLDGDLTVVTSDPKPSWMASRETSLILKFALQRMAFLFQCIPMYSVSNAVITYDIILHI